MTFDRKAYAREWARRKHARRDAATNQGARTCQHRYGRGYCGGLLETHTNGDGTIRVVCPACERRWAGLCADCNAPVEGRVGSAVRCAKHKRERMNWHSRNWCEEHPAKARAASRRGYRKSKRVRDARNEYKRQWRKANRDKVREQKRRYALSGKAAEAARRRRERLGTWGRPTLRLEPRTCVTPGCDTIVHGRVKKCVLCKAREATIAWEHPSLGRGKGWRSAA